MAQSGFCITPRISGPALLGLTACDCYGDYSQSFLLRPDCLWLGVIRNDSISFKFD